MFTNTNILMLIFFLQLLLPYFSFYLRQINIVKFNNNSNGITCIPRLDKLIIIEELYKFSFSKENIH